MNEHVIQSAFSLFCLLPLFLVSLPILFVVQETLLPDLLERSRAHLDGVPWRSLLVGLINGLFFLILAVILGNSGVGLLALLGLLLTLALLLLTVVGLGVLAGTVGRRVFALWERPASPAARLLVGSVALEALLFVPLVGWLALIGLGLSGLGAVLLALWRRRRPMVEPKQT